MPVQPRPIRYMPVQPRRIRYMPVQLKHIRYMSVQPIHTLYKSMQQRPIIYVISLINHNRCWFALGTLKQTVIATIIILLIGLYV